MKFAVDKIDNGVVLLENIKDNSKVEVSLDKLPLDVKETDILVYKNNKYEKDDNEKEERLRLIEEKMNKLRKDR
ncbi:MAG: DUF3006 domain-containing protein [Tenericutes bacterium]|nr:DUF3006 domain-containing protein [Mycoplasmatota bacterium]